MHLVRRNEFRETERTLRRTLWYTDGERYNDLFVHGVFDDEREPEQTAGDEYQDVDDLEEYDRYFDQLDGTRTMTGAEMLSLNSGGSWI